MHIEFGGYRLPAAHWPTTQASSLLAIHGARSDHHRLDPLLAAIQSLGTGCLAGSLSGHTDRSPLALDQTSLARNLHEALRFADSLGPELKAVFGHSLGGALAMKAAERHQSRVHTLILSGPALYPEAAFAVDAYGPAFTAAISHPFGFLDSASLRFLSRFEGRVVLVQGEYDGLPAQQHGGIAGRSAGQVRVSGPDGRGRDVYSPIPAEVFDAIAQAAAGRLSVITLEACDHKLFDHLRRHPATAAALAACLCEQMQATTAPHCWRIATDGQVIPAPVTPYPASFD